MKHLRVGVIGAGSMGRHHARIYSEMREVKLVGVSDVHAASAKEVADRCKTRPCIDYEALLSEGLDAVSIAVPTTAHRDVACAVLKKGINVLLEKPIADTLEGAEKIIKAANASGAKLMVGHVERFNPIIPVIKQSIKDEALITIAIKRVGPLPPRVKDVGVVVDLGVHDIDLIRHLAGSDFHRMSSFTSSNIAEKEDAAVMSFRMKNGVLAHVATDWLTPYKVREIEVSTKHKFVKGDFINQKVTEYGRYKEDGSYMVKSLAVPPGEPLRLELSSFIRAVREDREPEVTGADGLEALKVALRCLEIAAAHSLN